MAPSEKTKDTVLIIGSAPDAVRARLFDCRQLSAIVAINNAWKIRDDWTHLVCPEDFQPDRRPQVGPGQEIITHEDYVPANNAFGGIVYAGGTMAFTAAYWSLFKLRPKVLAFIGCDMIYDREDQSHFYGKGTADPLRADPTLQSLEAKSERLKWLAARKNCLCVNLSKEQNSRLTFPRLADENLSSSLDDHYSTGMERLHATKQSTAIDAALDAEKLAAQFVKAGDYWNAPQPLDVDQLKRVDALWLKVAPSRIEQAKSEQV